MRLARASEITVKDQEIKNMITEIEREIHVSGKHCYHKHNERMHSN
jgi:hypothetical protein